MAMELNQNLPNYFASRSNDICDGESGCEWYLCIHVCVNL